MTKCCGRNNVHDCILQEQKFKGIRSLAYGKFTKFKFPSSEDFYKSFNHCHITEIQISLIFNSSKLTILSQVAKLNYVYISILRGIRNIAYIE